MNMKRIDAAIKAYDGVLEPGDIDRLAFFRSLWQCVCVHEGDALGYGEDAPSAKDVRAWYAAGEPVFANAPAPVDPAALAASAEELSAIVRDSRVFPREIEEAIAQTKWDRICKACDTAMAGREPVAFLEELEQVLSDDGKSEAAAHALALVAQLAVRSQIEPAARAAAALLPRASFESEHPLACPVCGGAPALAQVGGATSSNGRGRVLHCLQCGMSWEFERVRCARCGTTNQAHLHYHHIEGDDAHRIASCEECGDYIRTVFVEDALSLVSPEVEDVVMARLDAVALQARL